MDHKYTKRTEVRLLDRGDVFYFDGEKHIVDVPASSDRLDSEWCLIDIKGQTFWESEFPSDKKMG